MVGRIREALRRRPLLGVLISLAIHVALVLALVGVHPQATPKQKRGDALIVELPNLDEPATPGTPGPQADAAPVPAAPAPKAASAPKAPPAPARPTPAPPKPPVAERPTPKPAPREAPRAAASAPQPPPAAERGDIPTTKSAPQPESAKAESPKPEPATPPAVASAPPTPPGPVAMVPPAPPDFLNTFRRGGGGGGIGAGGSGGTGVGRGGILGEPIPLDSKDPDFTDYLERVRRLIKQHWGYPCIKNAETRECEYKSARLVVDFGVLREGPVQFVEVEKSSGYAIYDAYAVNAIKFASPFPPLPAGLIARMPPGSTGAPIRVNFTYVLETGITNVR